MAMMFLKLALRNTLPLSVTIYIQCFDDNQNISWNAIISVASVILTKQTEVHFLSSHDSEILHLGWLLSDCCYKYIAGRYLKNSRGALKTLQ